MLMLEVTLLHLSPSLHWGSHSSWKIMCNLMEQCKWHFNLAEETLLCIYLYMFGWPRMAVVQAPPLSASPIICTSSTTATSSSHATIVRRYHPDVEGQLTVWFQIHHLNCARHVVGRRVGISTSKLLLFPCQQITWNSPLIRPSIDLVSQHA